jgi:DNA-binding transcriptional ArsR family regulator
VSVWIFLLYTQNMLETIFGNETVATILLNIYHYEAIHARAIARNMGKVHGGIVHQLDRLEAGGLLVSREVGRTRVYSLNPKSPYTAPVKQIIQITYDALPVKMKEKLFSERTRPRSKNKPVIKPQ